MTSKSPFKLAGLTNQHKDFLKNYATVKTGKRSITQGIIALINEKMQQDDIAISEQAEILLPFKEQPINGLIKKERVQFSLIKPDYHSLEKLAKHTDSSIQHYIICMIRNHLYHKHELLGNEIENLRKSNYELYRIGVNINQIAKAINAGHKISFDINMLNSQIKKHTEKVEKILKDNLNRY